MKLILISLVSLFCLSGCMSEAWHLKYEPTTPEEKKAVAEHVEKVINAFAINKLGGDDQDLEDVVQMAHVQARQSLCRPTLWLYSTSEGGYTGAWKYVSEVK